MANGGYYGPVPLVAPSRLKSADLTVFTFHRLNPLRMLGIWLISLTGRRFSGQNIDRFIVTEEITLSTDPVQKVSIDGEIKAETPVRISVAPKALQVLVAPSSNLSGKQ